tara:strand:+ start:1359 stop:2426 length:1068 start_codon:yes stop_codon:yes gene_type:complete
MRLGPSLKISQALELRQSMEIALTQSLFIKQIQLVLTHYLRREDRFKKLYKKALKRGMVKLYDKHGMKFEFALVQAKDVPDDLKEHGNWAFSHCLFKKMEALFFGERYALARGSWLLFVVYDMYQEVPNFCIEYAAVHERGEQVTLGDHNLASKLEFAIARKEGKLGKYMKWIEEEAPGKFADVFSYQTHLELPDSEEFQKVLELSASGEEATGVREMIEEFEWPYRLLQKLMHYKKHNEEAVEIVMQTLHVAELLASDRTLPLAALVARIRSEVAGRLGAIRERELSQYISYPQVGTLWNELRISVDKKFSEMLNERQKVNPNYVEEVVDAGIENTLPCDGVLSFSFKEALASL